MDFLPRSVCSCVCSCGVAEVGEFIRLKMQKWNTAIASHRTLSFDSVMRVQFKDVVDNDAFNQPSKSTSLSK